MNKTSGEVVRACLTDLARAWLERETPTLAGEPDAVHQMRVQSRRLRALLRVWRRALGPESGAVADELRWVAHALGQVRDLEVLEDRLLDEEQRHGGEDLAVLTRAGLEADLALARDALAADFASTRFADVRHAVSRLGDLPIAHGWRHAPADRLVKLTYARCLEAVHAFDRARLTRSSDPTPTQLERLHHARRVAKSARYAAEALASQGVSGTKPATASLGDPAAWGAAFRDVGDALGRVQDSVVAERYLRGLAESAQDGPAAELVSLAEREAWERRDALADSLTAVAAARNVLG